VSKQILSTRRRAHIFAALIICWAAIVALILVGRPTLAAGVLAGVNVAVLAAAVRRACRPARRVTLVAPAARVRS
jgi:hypothetical protein